MESIGAQVREFLEEREWTTSDLAREIGGTVKRQHIEQLLANPNRQPRYLKKLAQVMGKTAGELLGEAAQAKEPAPMPEWSYEARKLARWLDKIKNEQDHTLAYAAAIAPILRVVNGLPPQPTHTQDAHVIEEKPPEPPHAPPTTQRSGKRSRTGPRAK